MTAACADDGSVIDGDVPQLVLDAQMAALNLALAPTPFQLVIADIDYAFNVSVSVHVAWHPDVWRPVMAHPTGFRLDPHARPSS